MFFIISKILSFLSNPLVWIILIGGYGFLIKNTIRRKRLITVAVSCLFFFSNSFILDEVMRKWECPAYDREEITEPYDYGIVLTGMASYDSQLDRLDFKDGIDRMLQAVLLYREGRIRKIFISGGSGSVLEDFPEAAKVKEFFVKIGIPDDDIEFETTSMNTHENAVYTKQAIGTGDNEKYLLITSAFHMRRALLCFENEGMKTDPYPVNRKSGPRKFVADHLLVPKPETIAGWQVLTHEWVGFLAYKIMGYI